MRLEPIANPTAIRRLGLPALALVATLAVAMGLALLAGANPLAVLGQIATGALGSKLAVLETLNRATPLIFTGLAVAVAFRAGSGTSGPRRSFTPAPSSPCCWAQARCRCPRRSSCR